MTTADDIREIRQKVDAVSDYVHQNKHFIANVPMLFDALGKKIDAIGKRLDAIENIEMRREGAFSLVNIIAAMIRWIVPIFALFVAWLLGKGTHP